MNFVNKPKSTEFGKFNKTIHEDGRVLDIQHDVQADIEEDDNRGSRGSSRVRQTNFDILKEAAIIKEQNIYLQPHETPYFFLIFHLPQYLCNFGEPLACQFIDEDIEEEEPEEQTTTIEVEIPKKKMKKRKLERSSIENDSSKLDENERSDNRRVTATNQRISKFSNKNIYRPSISASLRLSLTRPSLLPAIVLRNFPLNDRPLTARQKDEMQLHCLPRMLSSFKFPIEFAMEKSESALKKRGNLYLRRPGKEEDSAPAEPEYFNYEKQEGPERLYPHFHKRSKIMYNEESADEDSPMPIGYQGETLYSTLRTLQDIQGKYQNRSRAFLEQPSYNPKFLMAIGATSDTSAPRSSIQSAFSRKERESTRITISTPRNMESKETRPSRESKVTRASELGLPRESSNSEQMSLSSRSLAIASASKKITLIENVVAEKAPPKKVVNVKHWTTKHLRKTKFDREKLTVTIMTDRLGLFGFAYKRYAHFPFSDWRLQQNEEKLVQPMITHLSHSFIFIAYFLLAPMRLSSLWIPSLRVWCYL